MMGRCEGSLEMRLALLKLVLFNDRFVILPAALLILISGTPAHTNECTHLNTHACLHPHPHWYHMIFVTAGECVPEKVWIGGYLQLCRGCQVW